MEMRFGNEVYGAIFGPAGHLFFSVKDSRGVLEGSCVRRVARGECELKEFRRKGLSDCGCG